LIISKVEIKALRPEVINTNAPRQAALSSSAPRILETPTIGRMRPDEWFRVRFDGIRSFGHFAFSANIYTLLIGAIGVFSAFYYPRVVGRIPHEGPYSASQEIVADCSKLTFAVGGVVAVGIVLATSLLALVYPQYFQSVGTVRVLLAAVPANRSCFVASPISLSAGRRPWVDGTANLSRGHRGPVFCHKDAVPALLAISGRRGFPQSAFCLSLPCSWPSCGNTHILRTGALAALMAAATTVTGALCILAWMMK